MGLPKQLKSRRPCSPLAPSISFSFFKFGQPSPLLLANLFSPNLVEDPVTNFNVNTTMVKL